MTRTCTDCRQPIERGMVLRSISSQLAPVPFHEDCYRAHVPAPRNESAPADHVGSTGAEVMDNAQILHPVEDDMPRGLVSIARTG